MPGLSEFKLIDTLLKPLSNEAAGAFALSDDAAVLPPVPAGEALVVTKDALAVGVHMRPDDPPEDMARKALRVNLSDLAAMGATPVGVFMALCLGKETDESFLKRFVGGLSADIEMFSVPLMGGDIIRQPGPFVVTMTVFGLAPESQVLRRNQAQAGESLWVSGTIGDGALGFRASNGDLKDLAAQHCAALIDRYRIPQPRLALGEKLRGVAHACIDVSDGLVADVGHICEASGVGCRIDSAAVPLSPAAQAGVDSDPQLLATVLTGGDDYELAFTAPPGADATVIQRAHSASVPVARIGTITGENGVIVTDAQGRAMEFAVTGHQHA